MNSYFIITCEGCRKSITYESQSPYDIAWEDERVVNDGWLRRVFSAKHGVWGWFCCEDCACNSYNTKKWAKYWGWRNKPWYEKLIAWLLHEEETE
jgi:hypothetical protein